MQKKADLFLYEVNTMNKIITSLIQDDRSPLYKSAVSFYANSFVVIGETYKYNGLFMVAHDKYNREIPFEIKAETFAGRKLDYHDAFIQTVNQFLRQDYSKQSLTSFSRLLNNLRDIMSRNMYINGTDYPDILYQLDEFEQIQKYELVAVSKDNLYYICGEEYLMLYRKDMSITTDYECFFYDGLCSDFENKNIEWSNERVIDCF